MKYAIFGNIKNIECPFEYDEKIQTSFFFRGDGTMLGAIHKYEDILEKVKFIGINTGRLGFSMTIIWKSCPKYSRI